MSGHRRNARGRTARVRERCGGHDFLSPISCDVVIVIVKQFPVKAYTQLLLLLLNVLKTFGFGLVADSLASPAAGEPCGPPPSASEIVAPPVAAPTSAWKSGGPPFSDGRFRSTHHRTAHRDGFLLQVMPRSTRNGPRKRRSQSCI
ncbi:unnamed protein product [Lampetra planeri]